MFVCLFCVIVRFDKKCFFYYLMFVVEMFICRLVVMQLMFDSVGLFGLFDRCTVLLVLKWLLFDRS